MKEELEKRTEKQNRALHAYLQSVSKEMLDKGITLNLLIDEIEIYPNKENLKDIIKHISKTLYGKIHTSNLTKKEMTEVINIFLIALAKKGIELDFPSRDRDELLKYYSDFY